jgi:hypothetical protein
LGENGTQPNLGFRALKWPDPVHYPKPSGPFKSALWRSKMQPADQLHSHPPLKKNGEFNQLDQSQQYELNSDSSPVEMEEVLNKELKPQSKNFYLTIQATFFIRICCVKELRLDSLSNFRSDLWKVEALQYPSLHIQKKIGFHL